MKFFRFLAMFTALLAVSFSCSKDKNDDVNEPASWEVISTAEGLLSNETDCIFGTSDKSVWVGSHKGVSHFDGTKWTNYIITDGTETYSIRDINQDADGNIIVTTYWSYYGTIASGVYKFNGNGFEEYFDGELTGSSSLCKDSKGRLWFGNFQGGAAYVKDGQITELTEQHGLVSNIVTSIAEDKEGNIWIGTFEGLSKWDGSNFTNYTTENGLVTNQIQKVTADPSGNVWFARYESEGGAVKFDGQNFTHYNKQDGAGYYCLSIHAASDGSVWVGTSGTDEAYRYKDGTWKTFQNHFNLNSSNYLNDIQQIGDDLWFSVDGTGVVVCRNFKNLE